MIHIFQSIAVVHKEIANPHCIQCLTEHLDIVDMPAQMHTYILYTVHTYICTYILQASQLTLLYHPHLQRRRQADFPRAGRDRTHGLLAPQPHQQVSGRGAGPRRPGRGPGRRQDLSEGQAIATGSCGKIHIIRVYVCMDARMYVCMCVCIYLCMYVRMCVCMCVCLGLSHYIFIYSTHIYFTAEMWRDSLVY